MRKYFLGVALAVVFLAYSMILRNQHSGVIVPPASLARNSTTKGSSSTTANNSPAVAYKDGTYTGSVANAFYGNVEVSATIQGGKITAVNFIESPNENPNSIYVNQQATPYLKQEAIQAQSSNVSVITGATFTSQAFIQSLSNALSQAKS